MLEEIKIIFKEPHNELRDKLIMFLLSHKIRDLNMKESKHVRSNNDNPGLEFKQNVLFFLFCSVLAPSFVQVERKEI